MAERRVDLVELHGADVGRVGKLLILKRIRSRHIALWQRGGRLGGDASLVEEVVVVAATLAHRRGLVDQVDVLCAISSEPLLAMTCVHLLLLLLKYAAQLVKAGLHLILAMNVRMAC